MFDSFYFLFFFFTRTPKRYLIPQPGYCKILLFFPSYMLTKILCNIKAFIQLLFQRQILQYWFDLDLYFRVHVDTFISSLKNSRYSIQLQMIKKITEPIFAASSLLSEESIPFLSLPYPHHAVPLPPLYCL